MAPLWLIPLLKISCFPYVDQHRPLPAPAVYAELKKWGMIKDNPHPSTLISKSAPFPYVLTTRGKVYVEAVTRVPYPVCTWKIPDE